MAAKKKAELPYRRIEQGVDPTTLSLAEGNPRRGNIEALKRQMKRNGWWGMVVVQARTGTIMVGNHRTRARLELLAELAADPEIAVAEQWHPDAVGPIPTVEFLDVNDTVAKEIIVADNRASDLADNRASDLAYNDAFDLHAMLEGMSDEALAALTYTSADVEALLAVTAPPDLDDLERKHGAFNDKDLEGFWPKLNLQVHPDTRDRFAVAREALAEDDGEPPTDTTVLNALLDAWEAERATEG